MKHIGAHLLEGRADDAAARRRRASSSAARRACRSREIAHTWYRQPQLLPPRRRSAAASKSSVGYKAKLDTGTFSYACHAVAVAVDTELGQVELLDYVDRRRRRHAGQPDGRRRPDLRRPRAGHRHRALRGDAVRRRRPAARVDARRLPAARRDRSADDARADHMETPSPYTEFGQKGIGEGGAIAPPAAIVERDQRCAARRSASRSPRRPVDARGGCSRRCAGAGAREARMKAARLRLRAAAARRRRR